MALEIFSTDEFKGFDPANQKKIARNYFKENISTNDEFAKLPSGERNRLYKGFLDDNLPKAESKGIIDKVVDSVAAPFKAVAAAYEKDQDLKPTKPITATEKLALARPMYEMGRRSEAYMKNLERKAQLEQGQIKREEQSKKRTAQIDESKKPALQQLSDQFNPMRPITAIPQMVGTLAGGEATGKAIAKEFGGDYQYSTGKRDTTFSEANPDYVMAESVIVDPLNTIAAPTKAVERAVNIAKIRQAKLANNPLHSAAQEIIDSSAQHLGVELPKAPEVVAKDEAVAKAMNEEYGAPKVVENPHPEGTRPADLAKAEEPIIDTKAIAKAQQEERVAKANEEAMARKAEFDAKAKEEAEAIYKSDVESISNNPRLQELIDMRREVSAKQSEKPNIRDSNRQIIHENNGTGYETTIIPAMDSKNYNHDFALTKSDIKAYEKNGMTPDLVEKFKKDLDVLDNDPMWRKVDENPPADFAVDKDGNPIDADGNQLFIHGADNVAVGMVAGVGEDENGNITFDPEKFVLGLGGYTAVKALAKNPTVRKELREYAQRALSELDAKPHAQYLTGEIPLFAGEKARGADVGILAKAKTAIDNGEDAKSVWKDTGWIKDKDGKWKFEIDDSQAVMKVPARVKHSANEMDKYITMMKNDPENPNVIEAYNEAKLNYMRDLNGGEYTLSDVLDHDQLYRNYPTMKEMRVIFDDTMTHGGSYSPKNGVITLPTDHLVFPDISPLLHEIQHGVQGVEKFASGGNYQTVTPRQLSETLEKQYGYLPSYQKLDEEFLAGKIPSEEELYIKKVNLGMNSYGGIDKLKYDTYKRLHGETEARNVQTRIDMDGDARSEAFPHDTMDVNIDDTIVMNNGNISMMSDEMVVRTREKIEKLGAQLEGKELTSEQERIAKVYMGKSSLVEMKTYDIDTLKDSLYMSKGDNEKGAKHIIFKHFDETTDSLSADELIDIVDVIRKGDVKLSKTRRTYTYFNEDGVRLRVVVDEHKKHGNDFVVSFYSNRKKPAGGHNDTGSENLSYSASPESVLQNSNDVKSAGGFFSAAQKAIDKMPNKMDTEAFIKYLKNNGAKDDEITWSGISKAIDGKETITKDEIIGAFSNPVMQKKVLKSSPIDKTNNYEETRIHFDIDKEVWDSLDIDAKNTYLEAMPTDIGNTKYQKYSTKGIGENYREELTTLKGNNDVEWKDKLYPKQMEDSTWNLWDTKGEAGWVYHKGFKTKDDLINESAHDDMLIKSDKATYRSSHWDEPNVLLHTRKQDTVIDGDKTLLVEEIQSDWHQDGRKKGYVNNIVFTPDDKKEMQRIEAQFDAKDRQYKLLFKKYGFDNEDVQRINQERMELNRQWELYDDKRLASISKDKTPQAPYSKTWHEFGIRQIIDEAVRNGYERVAWVKGATQAKRYSLSQSLDRLVYNKDANIIQGFKDGEEVMYKNATENELESLIGKDPAKKLMESEVKTNIYEIKGEQLDIGGDGMKGFYDKILVDFARKYTKKWGVEVDTKMLPDGTEVHSFPVNAKMKEDVAKNGQALYAHGAGVMAGVGEDENGNMTFDPVMALAGIAGTSALMSKTVRSSLSKLAGKTEHLSDSVIQGMVRVAIKSADKITAGTITKATDAIKKSDLVDYVIGHKIYGMKDYMKLREDALRSANDGMESAARLHLQLKELSSEAREAMYGYMSGDKNVALTSELKATADTFITKIDDMGQQLVDEGILTKEAYDEWKGQYLHRKYASKMKRASDWASGRGEFGVDSIKMRGKTWSADADEYQALEDAGMIGKVSEGKVEVIHESDGSYKLRRDWTPAERTDMGEIKDIAYSLPETVGRMAQMLHYSTMLKSIPKKYILAQEGRADVVMKGLGYEKLTGSRYGTLNGKWVNQSIAGDLKRVSNDVMGEEANVRKLWNDYVTAVKMSHTVYNPTAHVNNIGSNVFLQAAAGLNPIKTIKYATDGTMASRKYGRLKELDALRVTGLNGDDAAELAKIESDTDVVLWKQLDEHRMFGRSQLNEILRSYMSPHIDTASGSMMHKVSENAQALYQGEDDVMRFSAVKQLMNDGLWIDGAVSAMDLKTAMKYVNDTIVPDYSKPMSKLALTLRDSGLVPFMSWTYYSTPILLRQLRDHPTRVMGIAGAWMATDMLFGVNPYDEESMPKGFAQQRVAVGRDGDKVTGMRVSSMVPHVQLANPTNTFLEPLTSGIPQTILGSATNYNFYFRKPITQKDGAEGVYHRTKDAVMNVLPSPDILDKVYNLTESKVLDKETRRKDRVFEPRTTAQEAASFFVNLQTYDESAQKEHIRKDKIKEKKQSSKWGKKMDRAINKLFGGNL